MALDVLAQGKVVRQAQERRSGAGRTFVTAQLAVATDDESALLSLVAFKPDIIAGLLALAVGDSVAVAGRAKLSAWADRSSGEPRAELSVVVDQLLSPYMVDKRRKRLHGDAGEPKAHTQAPKRDRAVAGHVATPAPALAGRSVRVGVSSCAVPLDRAVCGVTRSPHSRIASSSSPNPPLRAAADPPLQAPHAARSPLAEEPAGEARATVVDEGASLYHPVG